MILDGQSSEAIEQAADRLRAGGLVAFPTETVYGLGADATQGDAVAGIFSAKGRPSDHPLIVHVAAGVKGEESLSRFAQPLPPFARKLIQAFWPGPLTLIVTRQPGVAAEAAGGQDTVGLRCPSHPVAQALLAACAERGVAGLAAPSANRFGRVSPTTAAHVQQEFGDELWVLDGGACAVGIESTIVDCSRGAPVLLRPGAITRAQIEA
ncbi:MAG: threonylcarbamoyl-AMP synthase, partial [Gammaproteobacteria bacterium]|nr:threonylcarbamoyl-AMP synthase [Gammaproteobacteria bacterium]